MNKDNLKGFVSSFGCMWQEGINSKERLRKKMVALVLPDSPAAATPQVSHKYEKRV